MDQSISEGLARRWCILSGNDPDEQVTIVGENGEIAIPRWKLVAQDIVPMFAWVQLYIEFHKGAKDANPRIVTLDS